MTNALQGRRILVIEDESLVAMLLETILDDMGCAVVGPESNIDDGLIAATTEASLDAALLDVNVAGREVFPVAEALKARGVPFVFSTGYGEAGLPEHHHRVSVRKLDAFRIVQQRDTARPLRIGGA